MYKGWEHTLLTSVNEVKDVIESLDDGNWFCRGQSQHYEDLLPSIDRGYSKFQTRRGKLTFESISISRFRLYAKSFTEGEEASKHNDIIALMVLQHYGVPTRLLDWSISPKVAAFFAVLKDHYADDEKDGEIWTFNRTLYEELGAEQWKKHPETTTDRSGDRDKIDLTFPTAFTINESEPWIVCSKYIDGFPRDSAQKSWYTMTSCFGKDHGEMIKDLLNDLSKIHVYIIKAELKQKIRNLLKDVYKIDRGSLFPDSAGAAKTVLKEVFFQDI